MRPSFLRGFICYTCFVEAEVVSGAECKNALLDRICSVKWSETYAVQLVSVLREVPMAEEQAVFVMNKALRQLSNVQMNELPALVYQLFLLSRQVCTRLPDIGTF